MTVSSRGQRVSPISAADISMAIRLADYSSYLRSKGLRPIRIERTKKRPGELVLKFGQFEVVRKAVGNG